MVEARIRVASKMFERFSKHYQLLAFYQFKEKMINEKATRMEDHIKRVNNQNKSRLE